MLFVDAALSGASGLNLWSGHKVPTPQRSARLYRAVVDSGLASTSAARCCRPSIRFCITSGRRSPRARRSRRSRTPSSSEIERVRARRHHRAELAKVRAQLRARFVYDSDSVTDIAHQLGYFETIATWQTYHELIPQLATVTLDQVNAAARRYLTPDNRTIGWFEPEVASFQLPCHEGRCVMPVFVALAAANWQLPGVPMPLIPSGARCPTASWCWPKKPRRRQR